ncbi:MAG: WbqC family protein, partial [Deltaproteobacteria bacterium]|nr:WbqC family protein [Deltaproteobacteria bacterium]
MGKKLAIIQSNYIPWKGYFDIMNMADEFILYDHVQYTKEDWRNRNKIKTPSGPAWLTIPILVKGRANQRICDAEVNDSETDWARKHWASICQNYSRSRYFKLYRDRFEALYITSGKERKLSQINFRFISLIRDILGITTRMTWSMDYAHGEDRVERLVSLCKELGCDEY